MEYKNIRIPTEGEKIFFRNGEIIVPDQPIIPFIEGDGIGPDICRATLRVLKAAISQAYGDKKKIHWMEIFAGEKAKNLYGEWLPKETLTAIEEYKVALKGPLTTPIGGGFRSLNVSIRQALDLYAAVRPIRYFSGVPSTVK
ncbi:MAG: isocitrate/isopropylmalate family dehydrogenase, partial [Desulfobacterota bacterium]|nr:isocitrate/isopropylmalate family dehydrogenase [Thermodesulfobacteriota bacterium]